MTVTILPIQAHRRPSDCRKIGQGRNILCRALHAKFQNHRTSGSGEDFEGFLPYIGVAVIFVM